MDLNLIIMGIFIGIIGILLPYILNNKTRINDKISDINRRVEHITSFNKKKKKKKDTAAHKPPKLKDPLGGNADWEICRHEPHGKCESYIEHVIIANNGCVIGDVIVDDVIGETSQAKFKIGGQIGGRDINNVAREIFSDNFHFKYLELYWNNLPKGKLLYNPPTEMKLGVKERIEVRIAKDLTEDLTEGLKSKGIPHEEEIKVSPQMTVHLDGSEAFEIKRLFTKESRAIVGNYTQWNWDVTPLKAGIHKLMLLINARIELPGYESKWIDFPVLEKEIKIKVNYSYKIKKILSDYWQWIIGTIIALSGATIALFGLWKP